MGAKQSKSRQLQKLLLHFSFEDLHEQKMKIKGQLGIMYRVYKAILTNIFIISAVMERNIKGVYTFVTDESKRKL